MIRLLLVLSFVSCLPHRGAVGEVADVQDTQDTTEVVDVEEVGPVAVQYDLTMNALVRSQLAAPSYTDRNWQYEHGPEVGTGPVYVETADEVGQVSIAIPFTDDKTMSFTCWFGTESGNMNPLAFLDPDSVNTAGIEISVDDANHWTVDGDSTPRTATYFDPDSGTTKLFPHFLAITTDGTNHRVYVDGSLISTTANTSGFRASRIAVFAAEYLGIPGNEYLTLAQFVALPALHKGTLSGPAIAALWNAGMQTDFSDDGAFVGPFPIGLWIDKPSSQVVHNSGSIATSAPRPRIGTVAGPSRHPPIRTWLRTSGAAGSYYRALGPQVSRSFFPVAGGFANASLRLWFKRPATPAVGTGTIVQIGGLGGGSSITLNLGTVGPEVPTIVVTDGSNTVDADFDPFVFDPVRIYQLVIVSDVVLQQIRVWIDDNVHVVDVSSLVPPAVAEGEGFTIGSNNDNTEPLDIEWTGLGVAEGVINAEEVESLWSYGWSWVFSDPTPDGKWIQPTQDDPAPEDPSPPVKWVWVDDIDDGGLVPGATPETPPLVAFSGTKETLPSWFWAWVTSTHEIGVSSSAWWDPSAADPLFWPLAFANAAVEEAVGEVPRVHRVTMRDDGVMLLSVDATLYPGVGYVLEAPADLVGDEAEPFGLIGPKPPRAHTAFRVPALLDIDSPLRAGRTRTSSGEPLMSGELATTEKLIWAILLTPRGSIEWSQRFGTDLQHKRLSSINAMAEKRRIAAQIRDVPYISNIDVQILFEGNTVDVAIIADSEYGPFYSRRTVYAP